MFTDSQFLVNPATLSNGLKDLFPEGVIVAELRQPGDVRLLYPAERESLGASAVPKRVAEFAAGRLCARRALAEFGIVDFALRVGDNRQPLWPAAVVGSISHTTGLCAAAAAEKAHVAAVGLDCEIVGHVPAEIWPTICLPEEWEWLTSLASPAQPAAVALLFAAKEAFYKCQYPLVREWLDFHDISVSPSGWGTPRGEFTVQARRPIALMEHTKMPVIGQYVFHEDFISAGIALRA